MRQCHYFAQKKKEKEEGKKRKRKLSLENQTIAMTPLSSGFLIKKIFWGFNISFCDLPIWSNFKCTLIFLYSMFNLIST